MAELAKANKIKVILTSVLPAAEFPCQGRYSRYLSGLYGQSAPCHFLAVSYTHLNYAMLGFDTGFFFLKGLSRYGSELENNLSKICLLYTSIVTASPRILNFSAAV